MVQCVLNFPRCHTWTRLLRVVLFVGKTLRVVAWMLILDEVKGVYSYA